MMIKFQWCETHIFLSPRFLLALPHLHLSELVEPFHELNISKAWNIGKDSIGVVSSFLGCKRKRAHFISAYFICHGGYLFKQHCGPKTKMRSGARPYKLSSSLVIALELRTSSGTVPSSFSLCNRCASLTIVSWPSEWFRMRILRHLD